MICPNPPPPVVRAAFLLGFCAAALEAVAVPVPERRPFIPDADVGRRAAEDAGVPTPVPKPAGIEEQPAWSPTPPAPDLIEAEVPPDPIPDPICDELEQSGEVEFERLDRIMENQCSALTPIRLLALAPKGGSRVRFETPVIVTCAVARQALVWLTTAVQPAAVKHLGAQMTVFRQTGGYECRGRNRVPGAKISEHGMANALDIGGFEFADGRVVTVGLTGETELGFLQEIRAAACGPFSTVLGPGVAAHDSHFHFDLAKRARTGRWSTYCK